MNGREAAAYRHDDYTVGWVCALPKEHIAAIAMLDAEHPELPNTAHDHNAYTFGSVGRHNVVIACLPADNTGTVSAAVVATQMVRAFRNLKFILMVGIGGAVPSYSRDGGHRPDVRLGDVVVGTPTGQFPGVVHWDFGKAEQDGFKRTGTMSRPPRFLLTRLAKLQTEHEMRGSRIPEYLEAMVTRWPRLRAKYSRSRSHQDVLFEPGYRHVASPPGRSPDEAGCRHCDPQRTIRRQPREMKIHYGLIASGTRAVRSAALRDGINRDLAGNVLCFDTEAAGLLDLPCLVVRGISDYCDSHGDAAWEEHAAAVAAAFAVELLSHVPPASELDMELDVWEKPSFMMRMT